MGDVLQFTNPKWFRLEPNYPQPHEINCLVVYNFLDWALPIPDQLSIFERKWLQQIKGYRNRETYAYLSETRDRWDASMTYKIYGSCQLMENVRR
jgi:hypothetical protein